MIETLFELSAMRSARLFGLRQLEGFTDGFWNDGGDGKARVPFCDRSEQCDDVQMLVRFLVHPVLGSLAS